MRLRAPRTLRSLALAGALLVAAGAAAGCGGGGSGEDLSMGLTPPRILERAAEEAAGLDTYTVAFAGTADIRVTAEGGLANLVNGPTMVEGEGRADAPDLAAVDATIDFSGLPVQASATKVGGELYIGALGQDYRLDVPAATVEGFRPQALVPTLAGWVAAPREVGRADVDGDPTVQIAGAIDPEAVLADLGPLLGTAGGAAPDPAAVREALADGEVNVWVGTEDLRPRRVRVRLDIPDASAIASGVEALSADLTGTFSGFDEPVDIGPPANARTLSPDELGSLTGG